MMIGRRGFLVFFFWIILIARVFAYNDSVVLAYHYDSLALNQYGNSVISELANDNGLSLRKCFIQFNYSIKITSFLQDNGQEIVLSITPKQTSGTRAFRKYDLSHVLWPQQIRIKVLWSNQDGKECSARLFIIDLPTAKVLLPANATNIRVELIKPIVDKEYRDSFFKYLSRVKDYQALNLVLQRGNELISRADFDKGDPFCSLLYYAEAERIRQKADSMNLIDSLPLQVHDPAELLRKQKELAIECYRRSLAMERLVAKGSTSYELKSKDIAGVFVDLMTYWVKHPDFLNPSSNKVFVDYATYNWSGAWCSGFSSTINHLVGLTSDYELQEFLTAHGREILHNLQLVSEQLLANQDFNQSAILTNNAVRLARSLRMHNEADAIARRISKSSAGIYRSYLEVAESAIANGQMQMAEKYLTKALDYKQKNGGEVLDQMTQANALELFANACLSKGASLAAMGDYNEALRYLHKAKEYALRIGFYANADQLRNQLCDVYQHKYDETLMIAVNAFKDGNTLAGAEQYRQAKTFRLNNMHYIVKRFEEDSLFISERKGFILSSFMQVYDLLNKKEADVAFSTANRALQLADSLNLTSDSSVCSKLLYAGNLLFDHRISCTGSALWDYEPMKAWQQLQQAEQLAHDFYLLECEQVNAELDSYRVKIENLECLLFTRQYERFANRAEANYIRQNFIAGQAFADSALNLRVANNRCMLDKSPLQQIRQLHAVSATYQQMLNRLDVVYSIQPADSIEAFRKQLHQYFDAHTSNLSSFSQPSIDWLLSKHQRQSLIDFYLQLYFKLVDYNRCIQLLDLLRINGLKSDLTIDFQQLLGKAMADSSTLEPDAVAVESYLDSIVPDKVWFASYRKAFLAKKIPVVQQIKNKISDFNAKGG